MAKGPAIRFCVGTPEDCRAPVWRFWANGNDVFLAERTSAGREKVTLHESGRWRIAFTTQSGVVNERSKTGDRVTTAWERPEEFTPGWTQGPSVAVMFAALSVPTPIQEPFMCKEIRWIRAPIPGCKVTVLVLFSTAGLDRLPSPAWGEEVGRLTLANGGSAWLVARRGPMSPFEIERTKYFLTTRIQYKAGATMGTSAKVTVRYEMAGQPCFFIVPLGPENLEYEQQESAPR